MAYFNKEFKLHNLKVGDTVKVSDKDSFLHGKKGKIKNIIKETYIDVILDKKLNVIIYYKRCKKV